LAHQISVKTITARIKGVGRHFFLVLFKATTGTVSFYDWHRPSLIVSYSQRWSGTRIWRRITLALRHITYNCLTTLADRDMLSGN
jgi:hypothetical protein